MQGKLKQKWALELKVPRVSALEIPFLLHVLGYCAKINHRNQNLYQKNTVPDKQVLCDYK